MTRIQAICICIAWIVAPTIDCFHESFFGFNRHRHHQSCLFAKKNWGPPSANPVGGGYSEVSSPPQADLAGGITYSVELTKRAGISWGSDLSFRWIYILDLEQSGEACASGLIEKVAKSLRLFKLRLILTETP